MTVVQLFVALTALTASTALAVKPCPDYTVEVYLTPGEDASFTTPGYFESECGVLCTAGTVSCRHGVGQSALSLAHLDGMELYK